MKARTFLLLILFMAIAAFAALNWNAFITPTTLHMGVDTVQAPLGLVMLGLLVLLTVLFLLFVVYLQTSILFEARRHARELHESRKLVEHTENSRFTELRMLLEAELNKQSEQEAASREAVLARLEQLDRDLRTVVEQSENTIAACIGELEDRLEKEAHALNQRPPA